MSTAATKTFYGKNKAGKKASRGTAVLQIIAVTELAFLDTQRNWIKRLVVGGSKKARIHILSATGFTLAEVSGDTGDDSRLPGRGYSP
jgi:hypothetical protein